MRAVLTAAAARRRATSTHTRVDPVASRQHRADEHDRKRARSRRPVVPLTSALNLLLTMNDVCCQTIEDRGPSPFEVSMLGWHDGLTDGMAQCRTCARAYHVEMVAWDNDQEVRVYGLKEVSRPSYDAVVAM